MGSDQFRVCDCGSSDSCGNDAEGESCTDCDDTTEVDSDGGSLSRIPLLCSEEEALVELNLISSEVDADDCAKTEPNDVDGDTLSTIPLSSLL